MAIETAILSPLVGKAVEAAVTHTEKKQTSQIESSELLLDFINNETGSRYDPEALQEFLHENQLKQNDEVELSWRRWVIDKYFSPDKVIEVEPEQIDERKENLFEQAKRYLKEQQELGAFPDSDEITGKGLREVLEEYGDVIRQAFEQAQSQEENESGIIAIESNHGTVF